MAHTICTAEERPDLIEPMGAFTSAAWPMFMRQDPIAHFYWPRLYVDFAPYQYAMIDEQDKLLAVGNSLPLSWRQSLAELPDTGWDWAVERAFTDFDAHNAPAICCALQIVVDGSLRGAGVSSPMVLAMKAIAARHGLSALVAPVRPNHKCNFPLIPMEEYIEWTRPDGLPFDPWLRVHARLGAKVLGICPNSMLIPGTVQQWETWTELKFPGTGLYLVPGALAPISIDRETDHGAYIEPNVWMIHPITDTSDKSE
jgi:hypothetical protein